jgi:hypothetical protein
MVYQCRSRLIIGKNDFYITKIARRIFHDIERRTKRRPYIRSAYFDGEKIFLDNFWVHLNQKNSRDRARRLRYFNVALELIQHSKIAPILQSYDHLNHQILYRFMGVVQNETFIVQIKEDVKREQRFFMSVFPYRR